jgi:hypothetical protein
LESRRVASWAVTRAYMTAVQRVVKKVHTLVVYLVGLMAGKMVSCLAVQMVAS